MGSFFLLTHQKIKEKAKRSKHMFFIYSISFMYSLFQTTRVWGHLKPFSVFSGVSKCKLVQRRREIHLQVPKCKTYIPTHIPCTTKNTNSKEGMNSKLKYMLGKTRTLLNFKENWETPLYFRGHIRKICHLVLKLCIFPKVTKILIFHMDICLPPNINPSIWCFEGLNMNLYSLGIVQTQGASFLTMEKLEKLNKKKHFWPVMNILWVTCYQIESGIWYLTDILQVQFTNRGES